MIGCQKKGCRWCGEGRSPRHPYLCPLCRGFPAGADTRGALLLHIDMVHGDVPFPCADWAIESGKRLADQRNAALDVLEQEARRMFELDFYSDNCRPCPCSTCNGLRRAFEVAE